MVEALPEEERHKVLEANVRPIQQLVNSWHSLGLAIDINPSQGTDYDYLDGLTQLGELGDTLGSHHLAEIVSGLIADKRAKETR